MRETDVDIVQHAQVIVTQLRGERNGICSVGQHARRNCELRLSILLIAEIDAAQRRPI